MRDNSYLTMICGHLQAVHRETFDFLLVNQPVIIIIISPDSAKEGPPVTFWLCVTRIAYIKVVSIRVADECSRIAPYVDDEGPPVRKEL